MVCAHLWVVQLPDIVGENALPTVPAPSLKPEAPMGHHPHRDLPSESLGRQALPPPTLPLQEQLLRLLLSKHHRRHGRPSLCGSASMAPHKPQHNTCGSGVCLPNTSEVAAGALGSAPAQLPHLTARVTKHRPLPSPSAAPGLGVCPSHSPSWVTLARTPDGQVRV